MLLFPKCTGDCDKCYFAIVKLQIKEKLHVLCFYLLCAIWHNTVLVGAVCSDRNIIHAGIKFGNIQVYRSSGLRTQVQAMSNWTWLIAKILASRNYNRLWEILLNGTVRRFLYGTIVQALPEVFFKKKVWAKINA